MNGTALFLSAALAPFGLLLMLLIAAPFKRRVQRMRDSKIKRLLLFRW